jgi:hypothetical protein
MITPARLYSMNAKKPRKNRLSPVELYMLISALILLFAIIIFAGYSPQAAPARTAAAKSKIATALFPPFKPHVPYLISMGGSIAAGAGLRARFANHLPEQCDQTSDSFAYIMAKDLGRTLIQLACSGARTNFGLLSDQAVGALHLTSQLVTAKSYASGNLVTLLIGANNINWIRTQGMCVTSGCPIHPTAAYLHKLTTISDGITEVINSLKTASTKTIVVDQYYAAIPRTGAMGPTCASLLPQADVNDYFTRLGQINRAIAAGVHAAGGGAILVAPDFTGHTLCSAIPWVQGFGELQPFHPSALGQAALARFNESALAGS